MLNTLPFTLAALRSAYADGLSPEDLLREAYRRIEATEDPAIFLHLRPFSDVLDEALALPPQSDALPLWGIPFAVKDNIDVAGCPTTAACPAYAYLADKDAFVVSRLRDAGALLIGKTNLDQFATGLVGVRSPYGVPRNSVDPDLVPGGSSSGSAVAVGHGAVAFALGTDTAGSGRVPAALNNIVGLKPSLGALSATGVVPACRTLDTVSVFAASVSDAVDVFDIMDAFDPADAYSRPITPAPLPSPTAGLKVGVPSRETRVFFEDTVQSDMFDAALDRLKEAGLQVVPIDFSPLYDVAQMLYEGAWVAERHAVVEELMEAQPEALHPTTAHIIGAATNLSATDAFRGLYRLKELERRSEQIMKDVDLLCVPTIPTFYTLSDLEADPVTPNSNLGTYTNFVNLLDMCGIAVPTTPRSDGLPGSITLLGKSGQDRALADLARIFESDDVPSVPTPSNHAGSGEMTIAICGAHMSGLPLNHELTTRGARLLKRTETEATYRLYALAGGPPERPGLIRVEDGSKVEVELWGMPETAWGSFLSGIPSPLSIGTIKLADGTTALGFLAEATGVSDAEDITRFGGWRGYLDRHVSADL